MLSKKQVHGIKGLTGLTWCLHVVKFHHKSREVYHFLQHFYLDDSELRLNLTQQVFVSLRYETGARRCCAPRCYDKPL